MNRSGPKSSVSYSNLSGLISTFATAYIFNNKITYSKKIMMNFNITDYYFIQNDNLISHFAHISFHSSYLFMVTEIIKYKYL